MTSSSPVVLVYFCTFVLLCFVGLSLALSLCSNKQKSFALLQRVCSEEKWTDLRPAHMETESSSAVSRG